MYSMGAVAASQGAESLCVPAGVMCCIGKGDSLRPTANQKGAE
jgi:hypothetical protein